MWSIMLSNILGIALVYMMIFMLDGPSLIRSRRWRELMVLLGLIFIGAAFSLYWIIVRPSTPLSKYVVDLFDPLARVVLGPEE